MSAPRIVLTGATGFIGSAVLRELAGRAGRVRALARRDAGSRPPGVEWVRGDLSAPDSLRGICDGADVLLHLASCVGSDADRCAAINERGSAAIAAEAVRAGVPRLVSLSTTAVYGPGPHAGLDVDEVPPAPVSPASRTRLAGEVPVLAAGGVVLRPGLVLGAGDRWVVPALAEFLRRVPARWDGGRALLSVVDVRDLARLIAALTARTVPGGIYHASHPVPVRNGELLEALAGHGVLPRAEADWDWARCLTALRECSGQGSERQFSLLARDHWYRSEAVWSAAGIDPGPGFLARSAESAGWYRERLQR